PALQQSSRLRGRVREVERWRRYLHDRGGGFSTRGQLPQIASFPAHGRHRVGSIGMRAHHTSRPPAKKWTTTPQGTNPGETRPPKPPRPRDPHPLEARDRAPSL